MSVVLVAGIGLVACANPDLPLSPGEGEPARQESAALKCSPENLSAEAFRKAGPADDGSGRVILPNGRVLTPVGDVFWVADIPIGLTVNADETRAYVTHNDEYPRALIVLDLTRAPDATDPSPILQEVALGSTFRGVALSNDGKALWVGGGSTGRIHLFNVLDDGRVGSEAGIGQTVASIELGGYIADLALSPDGTRVYAVANTDSRIHVIDTTTLDVLDIWKGGTFPYDLLPSRDGTRLYVSNMASSSVMVLDTANGQRLATIPVGKNPEVMAESPDGTRVFVANSDSDSVSVIDTVALGVTATIDLSGDPRLLKHGNINGLALSPDGTRLFVTEAGMNRVDVIDTSTFDLLGAIPTGWYPTEIVAVDTGIYFLSSKGLGSGSPTRLKWIPGFVSRVPYDAFTQLADWTAQVEANNSRRLGYWDEECDPAEHPVLSGDNSPIEHVILIIRENKTYDMLLGDLVDEQGNPHGDGDPNLVVFGEHYTPNFHDLARKFVNMDNYYANAEASMQGHQWCTQATCNDFIEKLYWDQLPLPGYEPASIPEGPTPSIFDMLFAHGIPFRNYGELPSFGPHIFGEMAKFWDHKYPFWTMDVPDVEKAAEVIREWDQGIMPRFVFIVLPNDHTFGTRKGKPTPQWMVADNDRATGLLAEALSHSPYWPKSAMFIIEDDPQGSGDHVDAHRSVSVVVSPWVRRGYVSSVHYDIPALFRTIGMILGTPPMGKNDAYAPPMVDIWVDGVHELPDYAPFTALPMNVPYAQNAPDAPGAAESALCDEDQIDGCAGLGQILWRAMRGDIDRPPYARWIDE
jgi:YVTN family beta-propeller protein